MAQAGVGAARLRRNVGVAFGESLDVQLVQNALCQRDVGRMVIAPVVVVVHYARLERHGGVIARVRAQGIGAVVAKLLVTPFKLSHRFTGVGVQQQLGRIETVPLFGLPRAMGAQPVDQARLCVRQVTVPYVLGAGGQKIAGCFDFAVGVKQAQLDGTCVGREDRKVDTFAVPVGTQRPWLAGVCKCHAFHSNMTVASGGRSSSTEWDLPCQPIACAVAVPSGVPTLLPP